MNLNALFDFAEKHQAGIDRSVLATCFACAIFLSHPALDVLAMTILALWNYHHGMMNGVDLGVSRMNDTCRNNIGLNIVKRMESMRPGEVMQITVHDSDYMVVNKDDYEHVIGLLNLHTVPAGNE